MAGTMLYFHNSRNIVDTGANLPQTANMKLDDAAAHLEALGNPTRLKIYRTLVRAGDAGLSVGRLQDKLKIAPSTLSHHIKALMVVGLINQVRDATTLVCHANYDVMRGLVEFLVAECCTGVSEDKDTKSAA
jgi:DNA-binding transcriptional ArsR family regulator